MEKVGFSKVFSELSKFKIGTHHPHCEFHDHHIVRPFGGPLCLGCFCMWTGVAIGLFLWTINAINNYFQYYYLAFVGLSMAPFPFLQMKIQVKWFKMVARFALGFGSCLLLTSTLIFLPLNVVGLLVRSIILYSYIYLVKFALTLRSKNIDDPCDGCDKGAFPLCEWKSEQIYEILQNWNLDESTNDFLKEISYSFENKSSNVLVITGNDVLSRNLINDD